MHRPSPTNKELLVIFLASFVSAYSLFHLYSKKEPVIEEKITPIVTTTTTVPPKHVPLEKTVAVPSIQDEIKSKAIKNKEFFIKEGNIKNQYFFNQRDMVFSCSLSNYLDDVLGSIVSADPEIGFFNVPGIYQKCFKPKKELDDFVNFLLLNSYTRWDKINDVLDFVSTQIKREETENVPYLQAIRGRYSGVVKTPAQTLIDGCGNCDDVSVLASYMLWRKNINCGVAFLKDSREKYSNRIFDRHAVIAIELSMSDFGKIENSEKPDPSFSIEDITVFKQYDSYYNTKGYWVLLEPQAKDRKHRNKIGDFDISSIVLPFTNITVSGVSLKPKVIESTANSAPKIDAYYQMPYAGVNMPYNNQ